jgi:hypothetical protein
LRLVPVSSGIFFVQLLLYMVTHQKNEPQQKNKQVLRSFETISQRVRRHISDIRSEITDEDIRNVKIEFEVKIQRTIELNR